MKLNFINKKTLYISMVALLTLSSCREDIVNTKPFSQISEAEAYSTPNLVLLAVNGVYNAAQMGIFNGTNTSPAPRGYVFGAAYFQQNEARGEDVVNTQAFYQITYESNYDPTTANNVYYWTDGYRLINRANLVKEGVATALSKGVIDQATADAYTGECLFFRALAHFEFLKHFARPYHLDAGASLGVPYREVGINTTQEADQYSSMPRNTVAECYTKILKDLNDAEALLPTKAQRSGEDKISKATKGAAIAIKMRVFMNMRQWSNVLTEFAKLQNQYSLSSDFKFVFDNNLAASNNESIFSIKNSKDTNPGVNGALASQFNGRALLAISPILWRNPGWLNDDLRRTLTATVSTARYTRKYKDITDFTDASPIVRYADAVLLAAEANARENNLPVALTLLNSVRNRSLANAATQAYTATTFVDKQAMVKAILLERRIELSCEGSRWGDIHRLINDDLDPTSGIPGKVPNGVPAAAAYTLGTAYTTPLTAAIPYTDKRFLWPIPTMEINSNPAIASQQNPGY